ncbi:Lead, cadmium, zinc and mercury transporting ATPase [Clostridiaceae bacterium JG1575]|nr:Lead, cadmium, zinc and mercury transporting ATPase [Clostridiaceae bacterium JG1575]
MTLNLPCESLTITAQEGTGSALISSVKKIVARYEPHVEVRAQDPGKGPSAKEADEQEEGPSFFHSLRWMKVRIILGLLLFFASFGAGKMPALSHGLLLLAYVLAGYDVVARALRNLLRLELFDENFLMTLATVGAVALGEYREAAGVMLFYMIGEFFQRLAVERSRKNIQTLLDIRPEFARVEREGAERTVAPQEVRVGEVIKVRPGERIPLDGVVLSGTSEIDTRALTGESLPRTAAPDTEVLSGSVNILSALRIRVKEPYETSTVARILELLEHSAAKKGKTEQFITKFARVYTPVVVALSLVVALVVPLLLGQSFGPWVRKALVFLVISCPCALVLSIPLGFFGGIGLASRHGILVKGSNYLEQLRHIKTLVLDKTGTLTYGVFAVSSVHPAPDLTASELLTLAASLEADSPHPIAKSIVAACPKAAQTSVLSTQELPGKGMKGLGPDGTVLYLGNLRLMKELGLSLAPLESTGVFLAEQKGETTRLLGWILVEDRLKENAQATLKQLRRLGVEEIYLYSGDGEAMVQKAAYAVGVDGYASELLPQDKVARIEELAADPTRGPIAFVGDGLNDTPVLARADVGISMGSMGSSAAIEASDVVLMDDSLENLPRAMRLSQMTHRIVLQNIFMSLSVKAVVMAGALFYQENIWLAIFADVGVALLAVLNSARLVRMKLPKGTLGAQKLSVSGQEPALADSREVA